MLPAIAVLHVRHRAVRSSGAILGTIAGTAFVAVGAAGAVTLDLRPAALAVLGVWWWTIGKMWAETGIMPREAGIATATCGVIALAGIVVMAAVPYLLQATRAAGQVWILVEFVIGVWLLGLAGLLWRGADVT